MSPAKLKVKIIVAYFFLMIALMVSGMMYSPFAVILFGQMYSIPILLIFIIAPLVSLWFFKANENILNILIAIPIFIFINILISLYSTDVVRYLARNVTMSYPSERNDFFQWDYNLQVAVYSLYLVFFMLITIGLCIACKAFISRNKIVHVLQGVFILIFPTHSLWSVNACCPGIGGCVPCIHYNVAVPIIMSTNPLGILISGAIAYLISERFIKRIRQQHVSIE